MSFTKICPQCAASLPDDAPAGELCSVCASAEGTGELAESAPVDPLLTPGELTVIGDFEIIGKLGQGGMGSVYRARQVSLDRLVALKVLPVQFGDDAEHVGRFQREARVASGFRHPNLVSVFGYSRIGSRHCIAMELVDGENLQQLLQHRRVDIAEALRITTAVARGLQSAWDAAQLVHRDIKPSNIYLSRDGSVKVGDLGLAKSLLANHTNLTMTGMMMGTPRYMSPEQCDGEKAVDFRADIYSLGCMLFEMLTGRAPYEGAGALSIMNKHVHAPPPVLLKELPGCPPPLASLVGRMLKKAPRDRPASYEELIAEIEALQRILEVTPASGVRGKPRSSWWLLGGLALIALLIVVLQWPASQHVKVTATPRARSSALQSRDSAPTPSQSLGSGEPSYAATKDAPFENTLGMKFVPVPGTDVLFCIHETRWRDYEACIAEGGSLNVPGRAKTHPILRGTPDSPAAGINWDDAEAFCAWLSRKEGRTYRLPTDREWSQAVGIGDQEKWPAGMTLSRVYKVPDQFPWGTAWPPPQGAGNYLDETGNAKGPKVGVEYVHGYDDSFAHTAPVMSFPPNPLGLYDLGGNVAEWVGDWIDTSRQIRVVRGGCFTDGTREALLSSKRREFAMTAGAPGYSGQGFRVVMVPSEGRAAARPQSPVPMSDGRAAALRQAQGLEPVETARPSAATKDTPFVNSLGMKFVPVPIVGGPTNGKMVLFNVWLTRAQDYETFAKEAGGNTSDVDLDEGPTHPVMNVSWDHAKSFCAWLTERERKAGLIGPQAVYRLPSDHEWSCAVGIGEMEDPALLPFDKDRKIKDVFPWGTSWPPPSDAGNYTGETNRWPKASGGIKGYRDDHLTSSPVGSFAANRFGLYDMGGNAWQWCEDWFEATQETHVLRGASWCDHQRDYLLSSMRFRRATRLPFFGFRCVLASVEVPPVK